MNTDPGDGPLARLYDDWAPWNRRRRLAPGVRLCMAADIERFSRFTPEEAQKAQTRLLTVLLKARQHARIRDEHVVIQPAGDGQLAILPFGLDGPAVVPKLQEGLSTALRDINGELSEHARIRLRVSLYQGHVSPGENGWVGHATIAVPRLLNSPATRQALQDHPTADFVLIVGTDIHRDYVLDRPGWIRPDTFQETDIDTPAKDFHEPAWLYVPTNQR
jgi:hypothetical protein